VNSCHLFSLRLSSELRTELLRAICGRYLVLVRFR
jgi:hypothetical protein